MAGESISGAAFASSSSSVSSSKCMPVRTNMRRNHEVQPIFWILRIRAERDSRMERSGFRHAHIHLSRYLQLLPLLLTLAWTDIAQGFRLVDQNGTIAPFVPYEQGFVGRHGDPFTTFVSDRVNEGAPGTPTYPRLYEGVYPRQICPGMVGPVDDGMYYCLSKEHGYCDRRSGTCFCNIGYQGISCQDCSSTHYKQGGLCYPKLLCPGDCSGAGTCHYSNGTCSCLPHRVGDDCSSPYCSSMFSSLCVECTFQGCTSCESGYYVDHAAGGVDCLSCEEYDPRCTRCDEESCLECTDPLLLSIRRSGARKNDPALPFDEMERELPHALEFGTQDPRYFASAEAFDVVVNSTSPLNETSVSCAQGVLGDDSWSCEPKAISHRVCGNPGTISFASPEYRAFENSSAWAGVDFPGVYGTAATNGTVRVTVTRTGGGYGTVGVKYRLRHGTTSAGDVTPHAHYTTSDEIVFTPGVVELSILLSVHEDGEVEADEYFDLFLHHPWGGARLGFQQRTRVTILDAEGNGTVTHHLESALLFPDRDDYDEEYANGEEEAAEVDDGLAVVDVVAGTPGNATIVARDAMGGLRGFGGDVFEAWVAVGGDHAVSTMDSSSVLLPSYSSSAAGIRSLAAAAPVTRVQDLGNGNYTLSYQVDGAGEYLLRVALCRPGGLTGYYTTDPFFQNLDFQRVDRVMNFTWGQGAVFGMATDFAGVRWSGRIRPDYTESYGFEVGTATGGGDAARLWIDGSVIIDGFERGGGTILDWEDAEEGLGGGGRGYVNLTAGHLHEIYLEYSERRGDAACYLAWSSPSVAFEVVPPANLYWVRELGSDSSPRALTVRSAFTSGEDSEAFGTGTVSAVAGLPSAVTIVPRDAFGNLRVDESDSEVVGSDHFSVVLEVDDIGNSGGVDITLDGVYGAAGSGGTVVTGTLEFDADNGVFAAEYIPFVAGTHLLNVTFQERLFEPKTHVKGSPFAVTVRPGEAFGRRCDAWGDALSKNVTIAGVPTSLRVRTRDVVGNVIGEGGSELVVYAFHREAETYAGGAVNDFDNGTYDVWITPTVAGVYDISLALDNQEVAESPYFIVVAPGGAHGPASVAYGVGASAAVATLDNTFYVQARDRWGNNLLSSGFNVTAELFLADTTAAALAPELNLSASSNTSDTNGNSLEEASIVAHFGNGSGMALVTYVPRAAGTSFLYVHVDGLQVSGSPFLVDVVAGPPRGANATVSGSALALATAGKNSSFWIQARDQEANPSVVSESEADDETASTAGVVFNVTLRKYGGDGGTGDDDGGNSTVVVHATVESLGGGKYKATYNATKAGNYSLEVKYASDGEHAMGSPFQVLVEPNQAFAPATLVWWDKQVAGSNIIHIQAADFWSNNITQGGELFVARWTSRDYHSDIVSTTTAKTTALYTIAEDDDEVEHDDNVEAAQEGDFWTSVNHDTASMAAGFIFPTLTVSGNSTNADSSNSGGSVGANVTDVGGGRYEITTATAAGFYWLEIGVVEPGGLWGTYYQDGGVGAEVVRWTPEAHWRTKSVVDFEWGVFSPEAGIDDYGNLQSLASNSSDTQNSTSFSPSSSVESLSRNVSTFPVDYFSARFSGFVRADISGEYLFQITTDSASRVALSVSGQDLFNDLVGESSPAPGPTGSAVLTKSDGGSSVSVQDFSSASSFSGVGAGTDVSQGRVGSVALAAGELVPIQLRYGHTTGEARIRMEWVGRTNPNSLAVIPAISLLHQRLGWKVAVDLHPAPTAAGASTAIARPDLSNSVIEKEDGVVAEEQEETGELMGIVADQEEDGNGAEGRLTEFTAGKTMEIVVQARDIYGNHRGVGGDSVQMYAQGPGGVILHGSVVDDGDGNYTVSAWPVVAGAYHTSILVSALEPPRWALGYRSVEQAMAGAHVSGSPFQISVVEGAVAANASLAYGVGIDSPLAGGMFATSAFTIRARDSMGNRLSSGSTGDFSVEVYSATWESDEDGLSLASVGEAVYIGSGEYAGAYNVTAAGDYTLHVTLSSSGEHVAGSPFPLHVLPGPALPGTSVCDDCDAILSPGNFSQNSTNNLRLSARDVFGNALETGGEGWFVTLRGEEEAVSDVSVRHPIAIDNEDGSYTVSIKPGVAGMYELQVMLLSRALTMDSLIDMKSSTIGGGGLTAKYYTNARLAGRPLVTRVDPMIRLDWGSGVPRGVLRVGATGGSVGVTWDGFLKAHLSGDFIFTISTGAGDEARLWVRDELVIDTSLTSSFHLIQPASLSDVTVASENPSALLAGEVVGLRAEYIHHGDGGGRGLGERAVRVIVGWESPGTQSAQALPSFVLYPSAEEIFGSPFEFSVS